MSTNILIANVISFVSALFTCAASWSKQERRIYWYQVGQCFVLALAYFFFDSYAGIITLLLCTVRNVVLALGKYNKIWCITLSILMVVFGAIVNNDGPIGWIVIAANTLYTLGSYLAKNELLIKINIIVDLGLWMVYEVFVKDVSSFVADGIGVVVAVIAIIRYLRGNKKPLR